MSAPHLARGALALIASLAVPAADARAKPVAPPPVDAGTVDVVRGSEPIVSLVRGRRAQLAACAPAGRVVRTTLSLRWARTGALTSIVVSGGTRAYRRCVQAALAGSVAAQTRGRGKLALIARGVGAPPPPVAHAALRTCQVDSDCTLHFQLSACIAQDPVAVNKSMLPAVRAAFPVRRIACGMGGPDFDRLQEDNANRYRTRCVARRCELIDTARASGGAPPASVEP
ncbi:MAG: hypothetical protein R3B06_04260 [Kofleriaceae bacterium]